MCAPRSERARTPGWPLSQARAGKVSSFSATQRSVSARAAGYTAPWSLRRVARTCLPCIARVARSRSKVSCGSPRRSRHSVTVTWQGRRAELPAAWRRRLPSRRRASAFAHWRTDSAARRTGARRRPRRLRWRKDHATAAATGEGPMATSEGSIVSVAAGARGRVALANQDLAVPGGAIVRRLFGARVIDDGAGMIQLDVPHAARRGADVPLSVEVNWWLVLAKAVARLYVIADGNRYPLLTSVSLIPDLVPPHVFIKVRLDASTDVRAVVECGDGTLLQVRRWVRVTPHDPNADDVNGA